MKIRLWMSIAVMGLMLAPVRAGIAAADNLLGSTLTFCVNTSNATRDRIVSFGECAGGETASLKNLNIPFKGDGKSFTDSAASTVTKAIIVVHGGGGHPTGLFEPIHEDILAAELGSSVWLVAPQFLKFGEKVEGSPAIPPKTLRWIDDKEWNGYTYGDVSVRPLFAQVSSFEVMDYIIKRMLALAPTIKEVVIIGHSGGGKFVNRYSIGTQIDNGKNHPSVSFRYLIVSPSLYLYLSEAGTPWSGKRYASDETTSTPPARTSFEYGTLGYEPLLPDDRPGVTITSGIDDYHPYGMTLQPSPSKLLAGVPDNHYMNDITSAGGFTGFKDAVANKRRLFLVGHSDVNDAAAESRGEVAEGKERRNRAFNYMRHLRAANAATDTAFCSIKGADHSTAPLLLSPVAKFYWMHNMVDCSFNDNMPASAAADASSKKVRSK